MSLKRSLFAFAVVVGLGLVSCRTSDKGVRVDSGAKDGPSDIGFREMAPMSCGQAVVDKKGNGERCACGDECGSGFCVDGVCCNSACNGTCQRCDVAGSAGMCAPVPAGMPPALESQCPKQDPSTCGQDGLCDGMGGCRKYPDNTSCGAGTCQGSTVVGAKVCMGGACTAGTTTVCAPYNCNQAAGRCFDVCDNNSQCDGRECKDKSCGKKPLGAVCTAATECDSGSCADGVCCNVACGGPCVSCNLAGRAGECAPVSVGSPDPHGVCIPEALGTCGNSGLCNGLGGCARYAAGTECKPSSCAAGSEIPMSICDGNGTCLIGAPVTCAPFICAGTACRISCTVDAECAPGNTCVNGSCGKKPNGQRCVAAGECLSNFCVDGVCCENACTGSCVYCASPNARGRCTNVGAGAVDPRGVCVDRGAASCGTNGRCNGSRACQTYANGTVCRAASCNATTNLRTAQGTCNNGACTSPAAASCAPYKCNGTACGNTCGTTNDCATPNICQGSSCGKKGLGQICARADECASNFCAQGVCCNSACTATCQSCNIPGAVGTCSNVAPGGVDPDARCAAQPTSTCGRDGTCNGSGGCRLHPATTQCAGPSCSGDSAVAASFCDGSGTCRPGATQACSPFRCNSATGACFPSCDATAQCVPPNQCQNSICGTKPNGSSCGSGPECVSGVCAEGVCCNDACTGSCRSCTVGGAVGTCTSVPSGVADPKAMCAVTPATSCGTDGTCNGSGGCRNHPSGTPCRDASCSNGEAVLAASCNGSGTCPMQTNMCAPYLCSGTSCATSCQTSADCAQGVCINNMCDSPKPNGAMCAGNGECASMLCVEGVCCNNACDASCESCTVSGSVGTCSPIPAGADDPKNMCGTTSNVCGNTGKCNGSRGCQQAPSGADCPDACDGDEFQARTCNGSGACAGSSMACAGFLKCSGSACLASCSGDDNNCTSGKHCNAGGQCVDCTSDAHCSGGTPRCNMTSSTCVQCTDNAHCMVGQTCVSNMCTP
jgi:hypothetical protein